MRAMTRSKISLAITSTCIHSLLFAHRHSVYALQVCMSSSSASNSISQKAHNYLNGKMILAPLSRGGNLPFRRLCADFGMETAFSEMIYARSLLKGDAVEQARLRRSSNEKYYGVQIATNQIEEGVNVIQHIEQAGADFVDLNCGCPIYEATRRGLGSSLLRSPKKLGNLVAGLVEGANKIDVPVTVKIRLGCEVSSINCSEVARAVREAGASALTIHGRTAQQGYSKNADWELIQKITEEARADGSTIPIIGNGDILTHYEAKRRIQESNVDSVMVGRGALTKPWIFKEFNDDDTWKINTQERIEVYRTLACYMKDHFGDDEMGKKKSWHFLPWHFEFLSRHVNLPEEEYSAHSKEQPLIQNRSVVGVPKMEMSSDVNPLDVLLANRSPDAHHLIANVLWESTSNKEAEQKLETLAESHEFREILVNGSADANTKQDQVLTNLPTNAKKGKAGRWEKRRGRKPGPKRTDEEIAKIRLERKMKKERILAEGGVWPPP